MVRLSARRWALPATGLLLVAVLLLAMGVGAVPMALTDVIQALFAPTESTLHATILWEVRVPRVLLAAAVGAVLAGCGVLMQALFRNPLADPGLIGVSSGAALGAVSVIVLGAGWLSDSPWQPVLVPLGAFAGAVAATLLVLRLAGGSSADVTQLLLCGLALNALVGACIGLLVFLATDEQLRTLTFWTLGSLAAATWQAAAVGVAGLLLALLGLLMARSLDALLLGEAEAQHLGVSVASLKRRLLWLTAAAAGAAVSVTGIIGFVGLVAPHMARLLVGPSHRHALPLSMVLGALLVVVADTAARTLARPAEIPLGVLTALVGVPFFFALLQRRRRHLERAE